MNRIIILLIFSLLTACSSASMKKGAAVPEEKSVVKTNAEGKGPHIVIDITRGKSFYYPLMAAWIEDMDGKYIQTLFVPYSVATGIFKYGKTEGSHWTSAPKRAPETLPYWAHKRGIKASDGLYMPEPENPVADSYSGATPTEGFILYARADNELPEKFRVMFEINQNWDWNEYWTNSKYPDDEYYKMSCQPALVYEAVIDMGSRNDSIPAKVIGHSHYNGSTGELFTDLSTITTALEIAKSIVVSIN